MNRCPGIAILRRLNKGDPHLENHRGKLGTEDGFLMGPRIPSFTKILEICHIVIVNCFNFSFAYVLRKNESLWK